MGVGPSRPQDVEPLTARSPLFCDSLATHPPPWYLAGMAKEEIIDADFEVVTPAREALSPPRRPRMLLRQKIGWAGGLLFIALAAIDIATDGRAFLWLDALVR